DDVLRWHFQGFLAKRDAHHAVDGGEDQDYTRTFGLRQQAAEAEDHAALVFSEDLDGTQQVQRDNDDDDRGESGGQTLEHSILHCCCGGFYRTPRGCLSLIPS